MQTDQKVAVITGASRGIGHAILKQLGRDGFTVVGTATSDKGVASIEQTLKDEGLKGKAYVLDISESESIEHFFAALNDDFPAPQVLVNNAGITRDNLLMRMKEDEWLSVINTNLNATFRLTKACVKGMVKARWGRIVNISSVVGATGNLGQANYAATKAGVVGFSKSLAYEVGSRGITVNVVAPGFIDTDMTRNLPEAQRDALLNKIPLQRLGQAEEIADAVGFLCSERASYITGETIHVNGGMYMS
jgi:3-oxoacyl-[acyl-carrier protein] reductase